MMIFNWYWNTAAIYTDYGFNYDVRVGENGEDIGNNDICARVYEGIVSYTVNCTCSPALYGDWVSINKSSNYVNDCERLIFFEVRVFSKYSLQLHTINTHHTLTATHINYLVPSRSNNMIRSYIWHRNLTPKCVFVNAVYSATVWFKQQSTKTPITNHTQQQYTLIMTYTDNVYLNIC